MSKEKLSIAQREAMNAFDKVNKKITCLGEVAYKLCVNLTAIQNQFDLIRNKPSDGNLDYEKYKKIRLDWENQVKKIKNDYEIAVNKTFGIGPGAIAAFGGAAAAMGVATSFGVASSPIIGVQAATNAAIAWLGGKAILAGGVKIAAGKALFAFAGPIGWAIAGASLLISINDMHLLQDIFILISNRDTKRYKLAEIELDERIERIKNESKLISDALKNTVSFGTDYLKMTEEQQLALGTYVNLMNSSTMLLVNPIIGLQPNYTEKDLNEYVVKKYMQHDNLIIYHRDLMLYMCNFLYSITLKNKEKKLLLQFFENNRDFLKTVNIGKDEFRNCDVINKAVEALNVKETNMNYSRTKGTSKKNNLKERIDAVICAVENADISDEEKRKLLLSLNQLKEERLNIMLTGCTGCGKSSTINAMFKTEEAKVGTGPDPETMDITKYEFDNLILWDTPGLGDIVDKDEQHRNKIIEMLHKKNEKGEPLIDFVLVIVDGSSRDLGTTYKLINEVIIPNLGEKPEKRILIAINKADLAMSGRYWDRENNCPEPKLIDFLDKKAESVRNQIKSSTGIDVETIYYSAGFKEEDMPQEPSYNLLKLLLYILRFTSANKRIFVMSSINDSESYEENQKKWDGNDEKVEVLEEKIATELSRGDIFRNAFIAEVGRAAEIGEKILGIPGKLLGVVAGGANGILKGTIKALFKRR